MKLVHKVDGFWRALVGKGLNVLRREAGAGKVRGVSVVGSLMEGMEGVPVRGQGARD